jgi:hypothetical protein
VCVVSNYRVPLTVAEQIETFASFLRQELFSSESAGGSIGPHSPQLFPSGFNDLWSGIPSVRILVGDVKALPRVQLRPDLTRHDIGMDAPFQVRRAI